MLGRPVGAASSRPNNIIEPSYENGLYERWRTHHPGHLPMGIAGIYNAVEHEEGHKSFAIAMLTINADDHPFMRGFHKPKDDERMVVILDPADY